MSNRNNNENNGKSVPGILFRIFFMGNITIAGLSAGPDILFTAVGGMGLRAAVRDLWIVTEENRRQRKFQKGVEEMEDRLEYLDKDEINRCCPNCGEILEIELDNLFCPFCGQSLYIEE